MSECVRPDTGSIEAVEAGLIGANYICNRQTATAIYLARNLRKPVLVEGPAGVGKTELARATAQYLDLPLIRMQCYEGLDESKALYEWKYGKQLLYTQILKDTYGASLRGIESISEALEKIGDFDDVFFSEQFLEARPLLAALRQENGAVLLVDEIDKSDQEFEAFLLAASTYISATPMRSSKSASSRFAFPASKRAYARRSSRSFRSSARSNSRSSPP